MKISYLCIVVCSICFFACSSDEYSEEDFFWTANPVLLRGEAEIKVLITNPSVIIDYFKEPLDPDYFMVLYSEEAVSFKDSVRVDIGESDITLTGLTNDTPYYVKVKTYKKGFKMIESFVTMSTPGSSLSIEDLDLGVTSDVDRFSYSSDGRYFLYQGGRHDKLHFIEVGALGQVTTLNLDAYLGRWAQDNNEFVFTVNETLDNRVYNRYFMQYDIEAASLDTVLNLDQSTWSFYNPQYVRADNEILYHSNFSNEDRSYSELWTLDIASGEINQITTFETDEFVLFSIDKVDEAGDILVSGYHNRGASLSLYSYNLESWIITPVDVTAFDVRYPILSPDGDKVIFTSYRSGSEELWVLDLTSHQYLQLSDHTTPNILPRSAIWRNNNEVHALAYEARENKLVKFNL